MDAIVLVGGQGARLRPLTLTTPKPMLPCAGVPLLTHLLCRLRDAGVDHIVLATSYRAELFEAAYGDGAALGLALDYVSETEPLDTAGGIRNVADRLRAGPGDPVVVQNGDILSGHDIAAQLALHRDSDAAVTLHLTEVADARAFGCVPTDEHGRVTAFLEKMRAPVTKQVNAGCYVLDRDVIDTIPTGRPVNIEREIFPALLAAGTLVMGYLDMAYWLDLGTPADFVTGSCDLVRGRLATSALPGPVGESLVLPGAVVDDGATLIEGTVVGAGAVVEDRALLDGAVLFAGARVGAGAVIRRSVLGRGAVVGAECVLDGAVLGDGVVLGVGNELRYGARVWPGVELPAGAVRFSP